MKNGRQQKIFSAAGFTLVEVIVTLTILSLLASVAVPAMTGFIDKANAKKCGVELAGISGQYAVEMEMRTDPDAEAGTDMEAALAAAVSDYGGTPAGGMSFTGPCGTAGCSATASADGMRLSAIKCPRHSGGMGNLDTAEAAIGAIKESDALKAYLARSINKNTQRLSTTSLDSTGVNHAPAVNEMLEAMGIAPGTGSWRVYASQQNGADTLQIYWTDVNIADKQVGEKVRFLRYEYEYSTGNLVRTVAGVCPVSKKTMKDAEGKDVVISVLAPGDKSVAETITENISQIWPEGE